MRKLQKLLPLVGIGLILASLGLLLLSSLGSRQAQIIVEQIRQCLPQRITGYEGIYTDTDMPVLALEGTDYVGILDLPGYGVQLPVGSVWETGKLTTHPCRFWGSAYDGTLVIGGSGDKGQMDFCGKVNQGDRLRFTDMTGAEFDYQVTWVDRSKSAEASWLMKEEHDLTLFARDPYSLQYIAVRCDLLMDD
jgi:sortase A